LFIVGQRAASGQKGKLAREFVQRTEKSQTRMSQAGFIDSGKRPLLE
jgi:hypothetical protein